MRKGNEIDKDLINTTIATEDKWFDKPKDINAVLVNPFNGYLATNKSKTKKFIYYLKGTEPTKKDK